MRSNQAARNEQRKLRYKLMSTEQRRQFNRKLSLKRDRGITTEIYQKLLESQSGVCAICKKPERGVDKRTGMTKNLAVDHVHGTKMIRGLLCFKCNIALGYLQDDESNVAAALEYLRQHREKLSD